LAGLLLPGLTQSFVAIVPAGIAPFKYKHSITSFDILQVNDAENKLVQ